MTLKTIEKMKKLIEHEVTMCNDNEALVKKANEEKLHGNFGAIAGAAAALET